ncbi:TVC2 protein, partial [Oceanites oceanicus]|nr:TVC2 protein [Oceanites oceanicus]
MLLLPLLALAVAWSHGQAQVVLKQSQASVTRGQTKTAWIECTVEGIDYFQSAYIHWYRHKPSKAPEWILYIGSGQVSYDDDSYNSKYFSLKKGTNVCAFSVNDINSDDEGTYYCAHWWY